MNFKKEDLRIEKFLQNDFSFYFLLVSNEEVMKMITERALELNEAKNDFEKLIENNKLKPSFGSFKILHPKTNEFVGLAKLELKNRNSEEAELGYMLLPDYWGKGIAGYIGKSLIEIAKKESSIKRVFAIIDPKNIPSRKVLTNNGFSSKEFKDFDGLPGEVLELEFSKKLC